MKMAQSTVSEGEAIIINGALLEGGGQILRNSAALSCLLKKPITINNIRAGRSNPGLRPQHLKGLELISEICHGKIVGARVQSTEISLYPQNIKGGNYIADTKTAGSICLLLQAALPCLLYSDVECCLTLRGGTNADMAPPVDYFYLVFGPMTARLGVNIECELRKRGFYPKGGGEVRVKVQPVKLLKSVKLLERGEIKEIKIYSYVAGVLPVKVAHIMSESAEKLIKKFHPNASIVPEIIKVPDREAVGTGCGIMVVCEMTTGCLLAGSGLGKKGVPAETVGETAAQMLLDNLQHGGCVDEYLQDQLILFMALAEGKSEVLCGPISLHTETAIHVAKTLTQVRLNLTQSRDKVSDNTNIIECEGIGLQNHFIS
ncbi:hypothetical protein LOTGIDRAFT_208285 [Lottia gigantea]|uniref:RNA 3'-terminal phosphate cyclase n=1 Tax=Lottia gigantea TaxID=225164 RepID=V4AM61_LOTGI|nr:hypothetical protein LOTGIDRAFT_208285 [Lottia gigantea]ESP05284.1 hypothetical protein LOTGIDRAFT_208285 [Lottia gigantea]